MWLKRQILKSSTFRSLINTTSSPLADLTFWTLGSLLWFWAKSEIGCKRPLGRQAVMSTIQSLNMPWPASMIRCGRFLLSRKTKATIASWTVCTPHVFLGLWAMSAVFACLQPWCILCLWCVTISFDDPDIPIHKGPYFWCAFWPLSSIRIR